MDKDLREAALAAFKKSASEAARKKMPEQLAKDSNAKDRSSGESKTKLEEDMEQPAIPAGNTESEVNEPAAEVIEAEENMEPVVEVDEKQAVKGAKGTFPKPKEIKRDTTTAKRTQSRAAATGMANSATSKSASSTVRPRMTDRQSISEKVAGPSVKTPRSLILFNLLTAGLLIIILIILAALSNSISALDDKIALQNNLTEEQAERLKEVQKFSRFKTGMFTDQQKGLQGVILILDSEGKVVRTRMFPVKPD